MARCASLPGSTTRFEPPSNWPILVPIQPEAAATAVDPSLTPKCASCGTDATVKQLVEWRYATADGVVQLLMCGGCGAILAATPTH